MKNSFVMRVKNIILPPFSEIDFVAVYYMILIVTIAYWPLVWEKTSAHLNYQLQKSFIEFFLALGSLLFTVLTFYVAPLWMVMQRKVLAPREKQVIGTLFYLAVGMASLYAASEYMFGPRSSTYWLAGLDGYIINFLLIRSIVMLIVVTGIGQHKKSMLFVSQMEDEQIHVRDIMILIVLLPIMYWYILSTKRPFVSSIMLAYFYSATIIMLLRKWWNRLIVSG